MNYQSGGPVKVGDSVLIENEKTAGVVTAIIENEVDMACWNVDEKGLLIESKPFGLVFWPASDNDPVVYVASGVSSSK